MSRLTAFVSVVVAVSPVPVAALTVEVGGLGGGAGELVRAGDDWRYWRGAVAPSDPLEAWRGGDGFDDSGWEVGPGGFGYADGDDETVLGDMEDSYRSVYLRRSFEVADVPDRELELVVDYDDGFVAYLNGVEIGRSGNLDGVDVGALGSFSTREAGTPEVIPLGPAGDFLQLGTNVLAVEGHNASVGSSDFSLIPSLRLAASGDLVADAGRWVVLGDAVPLAGVADEAGAVGVRAGGVVVPLDGGGGWALEVPLEAGTNAVTVEVLDGAGAVLAAEALEVVGVSASQVFAGTLAGDVTWSGFVVLDGEVEVPAGVHLTVAPGTTVMSKTGVELVVRGALTAAGTAEAPVRFTHFGDGTTWGRILMLGADDCLLRHCVVEFSDCEGDHKDYYDDDCDDATPPPGGREYFQAIVAVAGHVDIEDCLFQNLPDDSGSAEGDAIAIIADDPDLPGLATATVRGCRFIGIGQGVHTRFAPIVIRDCFFTGHNGDNDDIDLYGESTPPPLVLNNVMVDPNDDDMINPTRCSAILVGNVIAGSSDHGIVLRDKSRPVLINNLISDCSSAGISVQNQCDALLLHSTIVDCGRGVRFFDHTSRRDPPYCLFPGSGRATMVNCIIAECPTPFELADSPWAEDMGSHLTVRHCLVEGGLAASDVSANSTVTWGDGMIDGDAGFVDAGAGRFQLRSAAGRWDEVAEAWLTDATTSQAIDAGVDLAAEFPELAAWLGQDFDGVGRPLDGDANGIAAPDLGAYETVAQSADSRGDGIADGWLFGHGLDPSDGEIGAADGDGDGATTTDEWAALTDPRDPGSFFRAVLAEVGAGAGGATIEVATAAGRQYQLWRSTDLGGWERVGSAVAGTGEVVALVDPDPGVGAGRRFYQVEVAVEP